MEELIKANCFVYYYFDDYYPRLLRESVDSPLLVYSKKPLFNWNNRRVISIIGTRQPSSRGIAFYEKLVDDLSAYNLIIVSGLAYGVDVCAHKRALDNGLQIIAILGHGLERVYPENHQFTADQICEYGSLLTEFPLFSKIERENFIQRNRLVAGISHATIVIESAFKGGSLSTIN